MSPKLERDRKNLDAFLADIDGVSLPPIPIPAPVLPNDSASVLQALLEGQTALPHGVNELRANVVTKEHLRTFQALQSQAMHTYVQTELTPVHASFSELSSQVGALTDRIVRIEANPGQGSASGNGIESMRREIQKTHVKTLNASDPAFRQILILGFKGGSADERIRAAKEFATSEFGRDVHVQVSNEEKGQRNKQESQKRHLSPSPTTMLATPL